MLGRISVVDGPTAVLGHTLALTDTPTLAATESSGVLLRSFMIAIVVMAPVALWQGRRVRARRRRQRSASYQQASDLASLTSSDTAGTGGPSLESVVAEINRVASTLESSQKTELYVPGDLTVGGSKADPQLVEAVLRDALKRSGLEVTATKGDGDSIRLECRRR